MTTTRSRALKQRGLTGLCGPYAIVNALRRVLPLALREGEGRALARVIAEALPTGLATIMQEGTDRPQLVAMLEIAAGFTRDRGLDPWVWAERHPGPGEAAAAFWALLGPELERPQTAAILGFGDFHEPSAYYEPHWTCATAVSGAWLRCLDSDVYDRVRLAETGVRPEPGWEIEDCFILRPVAG